MNKSGIILVWLVINGVSLLCFFKGKKKIVFLCNQVVPLDFSGNDWFMP